MIRIRTAILFLVIAMSSCVSNKDIAYFQYDEIEQANVSNKFETIFKPDDLLQITISSDNIEATLPFNLPAVTFGTTGTATGTPKQQTYLIDSRGEIDFPVLGKLKLGGVSREAALELLKEKLSPDYVTNPTINIKIANFKVTVYGDVKNPGTFTIPNERVSILDAIGLAGDLNISGKRDNVLVIREENNKKMKYRVNLLSNKTLSSPVFYLQQNDVVYVEHNKARIQSASANSNTTLFISVTSLIITLVSILTR
ncbi:polysaccharide biosynthesis/export family protein [Polaribacter undariae]|uniref:Polysaccharide biosynthesis/export family protein n=1 Tax=Polaribacter sejongensis TaxID=985043 RepID=A0AAJ1QVX9_9FLAO|nr:polysaccharide biosynthesis/export family protein [Polaribacter undariae]MDN3619161.1 polysaccharide biosynthesis/export family protein [Polaribacter undariae]UWD33638.1 polysaccharide biosynthesis/export family protein [Polaribacter undariae]